MQTGSLQLKMAKSIPISISLLLSLLFSLQVEAFQIDLETSLQNKNTNFNQNEFSLKKAGFGVKQIISDEKGDRLKFFLRVEAEDNFTKKNIDQLYLKYKGPMGRWNITLGRSMVPFGLLTDYVSEMLILNTQETKTIGYKSDDGIKLSGFWKSFDYELLLSPGKLMKNYNKDDNDKMAVIRTSYKGYDLEDFKIGFSFLTGEFLGVNKKLYGIDIIKYKDRLVSRNEFVVGKEGGKDLISVFAGIDYSLFPSIDLNLAYTHFKTDSDENTVFFGMTYNTPFYGIVLRMGNKYYLKDNKGDDKNEIYIQLYKYYSHYF